MFRNFIIQMKQTNALKVASYQKSCKERCNLNAYISVKEIQSLINNLPKIKTVCSDHFLVKSTKLLRMIGYQFSIISFRKQEQSYHFLTLFCEVSIILISNKVNILQIKAIENQCLSLTKMQKLFQNISKLNSAIYKNILRHMIHSKKARLVLNL